MNLKRFFLAAAGIFVAAGILSAGEIPSLDYAKDIAGLVGNGKELVVTTASGYTCVRGGSFSGSSGVSAACTFSSFFPGGVEYGYSDGTTVLYGYDSKKGFVMLKNSDRRYSEFKERFYAPYRKGLVTSTPDETLDKAVQFSQYLLDLGNNGEFMLCELFRWLDIWARDLGSGLLPGALASGRAAAARQSLDYDLRRYALCDPKACKNTNDPSQGGTAESIGWTVRSIWNYYRYSGDKARLAADMAVIRPWVEYWIGRDYNEDGIIIDATEFMDHMIMMLTTNGVTTLAANSMFTAMLMYSWKIASELGEIGDASRYETLYQRSVNALNTIFWNAEKGCFNNMMLWGTVSQRSAQAPQAMLLKMGATDARHSREALAYLKENNWTEYGSLTITPRMNHVPVTNDQNVKIWPWWNLWEAEARFVHGDPEGGYHLLSLAASTVKDEKYPGFIEETRDVDGTTYGGNAFPTAAGNLLDVVMKDLFGVESLKPGMSEIKVVPNVPADWKEYSCTVPVRGGFIFLEVKDGNTSVTVRSNVVRKVFTTVGATVKGAVKAVWRPEEESDVEYSPVQAKKPSPLPTGRAAQFFDPAIHRKPLPLAMEVLDIQALSSVSTTEYSHIVIPGSTLPVSAREALDRFVSDGGQVILYGATVNSKSDVSGAGILGEQCGLIDWIDLLPKRTKVWFENIRSERQNRGGYSDYEYSAEVDIPESFSGKVLEMELGQMCGIDSVFVNGRFVSCFKDMDGLMVQSYPSRTDYPHQNNYEQVTRLYKFIPGSESYEAFRFGGKNSVEIHIRGDRCHQGLSSRCNPNIGVAQTAMSWQYLDEDLPGQGLECPKRKGVNYWGNEEFFNSWSTKHGLFGFSIDGKGVSFETGTVLEGIPASQMSVGAAYTDFALFAPMNFEVLAYTTTRTELLYPMKEERYPCAVRVIQSDKGGCFTLVAPALASGMLGNEIVSRLVSGGVVSR